MTRPPVLAALHADDVVELASLAQLFLTTGEVDSLRRGLARRADGKYVSLDYGYAERGVLEARALAALVLADDQAVYWSAASASSLNHDFRRLVDLLTGHEQTKKLVARVRYSNGEERIEMCNGSRVRFINRNIRGAGRGFSADLVIVADGAQFTPEQRAEMLPTLLASPDPQMWCGY